MSLPRLDDLVGVEGAPVLVRLDLNVPLQGGAVADDTRVRAAAPTVSWLLDRQATVVACSHLGKPKGEPKPELSLEPVAASLAEAVGADVRFAGATIGEEAAAVVRDAGRGAVVLLENLRFHPGETANDADFAKALAAPCTHYVDDAFGTAHRAHASTAGVPALFAPGAKAAGRLMEAEIYGLSHATERARHPYVAVVGGAKISTKTAPLFALLDRADTVLIGGGMANTFFEAKGWETGRSLVENGMLDEARRVMERGDAVVLPSDVVVADDLENPTRVETVAADAVPSDLMIVDVGPDTRADYARRIGAAATVFWNGPMGVFEVERFAGGTTAVARALADSDAFSIVGGGESVLAIERAGLASRIGHISTGGGASLAFIAGDELPGIAALETP